MNRLRRATWAVPIILGLLAAILVVSVIVARQKRTSSAQVAPALRGTSPQSATFSAETVYRAGLTHVVQSPVASLRPELGNEWRKLGRSLGRLLLSPSGTPSRYFELGMVVDAPQRSARLEILTSDEQRDISLVSTGAPQVITFGPLLALKRGRIGAALTSVEPRRPVPGADLLLSPIQARYLAPGESVTRMPALAELGPRGLRGLYVTQRVNARFAMTPGIKGPCTVALHGASVGGALRVAVTIGARTLSVLVGTSTTVVHIGPFPYASAVISMTATTIAGNSRASLFISDLRFIPAPPST